jgi:hypothetical protein
VGSDVPPRDINQTLTYIPAHNCRPIPFYQSLPCCSREHCDFACDSIVISFIIVIYFPTCLIADAPRCRCLIFANPFDFPLKGDHSFIHSFSQSPFTSHSFFIHPNTQSFRTTSSVFCSARLTLWRRQAQPVTLSLLLAPNV